MNKVAIAFSTRDRVELTKQSIGPLLQPGKFDLFWMDGSDTEKGKACPTGCGLADFEWHANIRGGADAAIVYGLTTLLDHPNNYDFVGLAENDVLLAPDWFAPTMALFQRGEDDGLEVGAVSARCYQDRILVQRDGYAVCHNLGAGHVIFTREAARLVLSHFRTGWTTDNRLLFAQLSGLDIGRWWAFRDGEHAITSDWIWDAVLAANGLASLALTPSPCEMIGQVPPLAEQGLTIAAALVEALHNDTAFETFAARTSLIRENIWYPTNLKYRQQSIDGHYTIFPHQFPACGGRWFGDWKLKWTQGYGPFSWVAGDRITRTTGMPDCPTQESEHPTLELPVLGECTLLISGGPKGGSIRVTDPAQKMDTTVPLNPEGEPAQLLSMVVPPVMAYRTIKVTALSPGITIYGMRTRNAQAWRPNVKFDYKSLPLAGEPEGKMEKQPWTICPECGCGSGEDHKRNCSRGRAPVAIAAVQPRRAVSKAVKRKSRSGKAPRSLAR